MLTNNKVKLLLEGLGRYVTWPTSNTGMGKLQKSYDPLKAQERKAGSIPLENCFWVLTCQSFDLTASM